jgi:hypothetical protein
MDSPVMVKKILVLAANPKGTPPLRLDEEIREIGEGLRRANKRDEFALEQRMALRTHDLRRSLLDLQPKFVHFCGHGGGEDGILLEDMIGLPQSVGAQPLANLFMLFTKDVECVLLNACFSEVQAEAICEHINYVIGMKHAISDKSAINFSIGFYDAIGAGRSVEEAFLFGKNAIELDGLPEELTPILLKRKSLISEQVTFSLVLSGTIHSIDKAKVEGIVEHLRQLSGDMTITLKRIESGSVRLILQGTREAYQLLRALQLSGEFSQILGQEVQKIEFLIEDDQTFATKATRTIVRITNAPYPGTGSEQAKLYQDSVLVETFPPGVANRALVPGYELKSGSYGVSILGSDQTIVRLGSNSTAYVGGNQKLVVMGQMVVVGPKQAGTYIPNIGVIEAGYTCKLRSLAVYVSTNATSMAETYYALAGQTQIYDLFGANGQLLPDVFVNAGFKQTIQTVNGVHQVGAASPILSGDYTLIAQLLDGFQSPAGGQKILPSSPVTLANLPGCIA